MNARLAGIAYLLYIAAAFPAMVISGRATAGSDLAARLATRAPDVVERFSLETVLDQWSAVFTQVGAPPPAPA